LLSAISPHPALPSALCLSQSACPFCFCLCCRLLGRRHLEASPRFAWFGPGSLSVWVQLSGIGLPVRGGFRLLSLLVRFWRLPVRFFLGGLALQLRLGLGLLLRLVWQFCYLLSACVDVSFCLCLSRQMKQ